MSLAFVVSTGRCGSALLSQLLQEHPDILSISELFGYVSIKDRLAGRLNGEDFWRRLADPVPFIDALARDGLAPPEFRYPYATGRFSPETGVPFISHVTLPMLTDDPDRLYFWLASIVPSWPDRPVADHYRHLFALLSGRFGGSVIVERTGGSIRSVAHLRRAFPEARFVYLSRDGMDCALSLRKHDETRGIPLASFGEFWSTMTVAGAAELAEVPLDRWIGLRYEHLLDDPTASLRLLARFLGVASPPEWLSSAAGQVKPARIGTSAMLNPEDFAALRAACAPGYAADEALHAQHSSHG